nr:MDR family MFS transporter [Paenibacillus turpanensis]
MIAIMAAMLFAALNQTIVGTALPRIIADLGGMEYFSWVFTVYMLASTVTAVLVGKLSDIYGRKPFIVIGLLIFIGGSFTAGLSDDIVELIINRGIQGLGAGVIMSTAFTAVGDLFAPRERGRWQGLMSGVFGLASVFGPTLGGYIVDHTDWKWVFWVFLPVGVVALVLIFMLFPSVPKRQGESVDYLGSLFLTTTIVPLLLAFSWAGQRYEWGSVQIIMLLAGAVLSLVIFMIVEAVAKNPVLPLQLFKNSVFTVSNVVGFIMGAGMFGAIMYMPFFVQGVIGTSATISGYVMMPMTLSLVLASAISGQIISKRGKYKKLALAGLFIMASGMVLLSTMSTATSNWTAILYMIVVGFGLGIGFPIFTLTVQNAVKENMLGVATASSQLFRQLGGTIGVSLLGTVMAHRMQDKMAEQFAQLQLNPAQMPPEAAAALKKLQDPQVLMAPDQLEAIHRSMPESMQQLFVQMIGMLRESMSYALTGVFLVGAAIIAAAFLLTFLLKEIPLRSSQKGHSAEAKEQGDKTGTGRLQELN